MSPTGKSSTEAREHAEFQQWVRSLSLSQLLNAMELSFQQDASTGGSSSHEYDLLAEMVRMQSPPPTPIHPRAVFYKPASGKGKTDGRNEAARVLRNRTQRPRFFRFFENKSISFPAGIEPFFGGGAATGLPYLVKASGGNGGNAGRRRGEAAGRRERNRAAAAAKQKRYEITASKFVTSWGDALSVGSSERTRNADEKLLAYSVLDKGETITGQSTRIYMSFCATSTTNTTADILRLLRVASRGNFLASPHHNPQSNNIPAFCSPWLDLTNRWFSLPMYLASRFEVGLWDSFQNNRRVVTLLCRNNLLWNNLEEKLTQAVIERTINNVLRDTLRKDRTLLTSSPHASRVRDGMVFDLVEAMEFWRAKEIFFANESFSDTNTDTLSPIKIFARAISKTPLLELHESTGSLREKILQYLQAELTAEIGNDLINFDSFPNKNKQLKFYSKKKKQKKKRNGRKKQVEVSNDSDCTAGAFGNSNSNINRDSSDEESESIPTRLALVDGNRRLTFPNNGTPFVDRNRNIVMCLSTLNDIVNEVFRRAGLDVSSDESDAPVVGAKKQKIAVPKANKQTLSWVASKVASKAKDKKQQKRLQQGSPREEQKSHQSSEGHPYLPPRESDADFPAINGSIDTFPSQYSFPEGFFVRAAPFQSNPWHAYHNKNDDDTNDDNDDWGRSNRNPPRERSILTEFFIEQEMADAQRLEHIAASSTAASLASSNDMNNEDTLSISDKFFISLDNGNKAPASDIASDIMSNNEVSVEEFPALGIYPEEPSDSQEILEEAKSVQGEIEADSDFPGLKEAAAGPENTNENVKSTAHDTGESRSITSEAPATPSPRLSPILLSLDDLRDIRRTSAKSVDYSPHLASATVPSSLPSSPVNQSKRRLVSSLSRENLRRNRTVEGNLTYRNVAAGQAKVKVRATRSVSSDSVGKATKRESRPAFTHKRREPPVAVSGKSENDKVQLRDESMNSSGAPSSYRNVAAKSTKSVSARSWNPLKSGGEEKLASVKHQPQRELCARSDTAIEGHEEYHNWRQDSRRSLPDNPDNITVGGRDGSTTITSMSHRESEETTILREERNAYSDMCLTLGAEVARLKNQLAAQQGAAVYPPFDYSQGYLQPTLFGAASFDPECMRPSFQNGQALGAMSDAGVHRGEYESQFSEDEEHLGKVGYNETGRRLSSGHTLADSDVSVEPSSISHVLPGPVGLPLPMSKDSQGAGAFNSLQTRLAQDIFRFVASTDMQHRKLAKTRNAAVVRMKRLVNTLWPRAQVKVYGSHVTALCLPSSDLDFVVCLPAVHKKAPADAPGVLEGRNAINETSQKVLARKLKGESWIDPRSMKLIERTVVPVIKVATKDTRARTVQLDISFDSPEHHGLEAVAMVKQIVEELPMIRPLVLVLKQFLLDRALLTAYTGGLSSYCLFLMVARYLQEQASSWVDCGSLLMGFLDFYGNSFDPRCTGISVGYGQYFTRPNYVATQGPTAGQHMWVGASPTPTVATSPASTGGSTAFYRRNSFGENRSVDGLRGATGSPHIPAPRSQSHGGARYGNRRPQPAQHTPLEAPMDHSMQFTGYLDPLFVDDPLSYGNNVGRNAFRIFQVQRAFSDAHRALVASLEWDIQSTGDLHENNDYPLLKCLLQSEDVFYEL